MSDIKYVVIELNALRNDWIRHNVTFIEKVTASSAEEAIAQIRDLHEFTVCLTDLIAIPEELYVVSDRYGGVRGPESL